jgi:hypothetical protein
MLSRKQEWIRTHKFVFQVIEYSAVDQLISGLVRGIQPQALSVLRFRAGGTGNPLPW